MESQPQGLSDGPLVDSISSNSIPSSTCNLCGRLVQSASDDLEIFSLCRDCKFLLLEDSGTPAPPLTRWQTAWMRRRRRRRRTRRSRHGSSESVGDLSSQQFTHLINMARQSLSTVHGHETSSHTTTPTGSTIWRIFSDSESEDFDNGETESNASFSLYRFSRGDNDAISVSSAYGGESDASTDRHAFLDTGIFVRPDDRSDIDFDTDIDPMHAGMNQWNSDEEDREWEEADGEEGAGPSGVAGPRYGNYLASPSESYSSMTRFDSPELERGFRQRIIQRRQALSRNIFTGLEDMEFSPYAANVADYLDERGFEELLEQLAESDNSRRGAPPASVSCVKDLPGVIIGEEHVKKGLACSVCKDIFILGSETMQLPCLHLYHAHCIVPWLSARNSCPLCRYELPTDDKDYEERKQNVLDVSEDSSSSSDGTETGEEEYVERVENEAGESRVSRGRWLFLTAAPVVSLVGVVLAMWLSNPQRRDIVISQSQRGNRTRRWLPFF